MPTWRISSFQTLSAQRAVSSSEVPCLRLPSCPGSCQRLSASLPVLILPVLLSGPVWDSHTNGRDVVCACVSEISRNNLLWDIICCSCAQVCGQRSWRTGKGTWAPVCHWWDTSPAITQPKVRSGHSSSTALMTGRFLSSHSVISSSIFHP